jgi:nucleoside-triphosphatase THEP1
MKAMPKILLTSPTDSDLGPLLERIVEQIKGIQAAAIQVAGFIKVERPVKKGKTEIVLQNLSGTETVIGVQGKGKGKAKRIGKHLIDFDGMEEALLDAISFKIGVDMYVMNEIGPLETMSRTFSTAAKMLLKKDSIAVLATVAKQGRGFVREVKRLPGMNAIELTDSNSAAIEEQVLKQLLTAFASRAREQQE